MNSKNKNQNTKLYKNYQRSSNSYDALKFFAIIIMVVDHSGFFFLENNPEMRLIGRLAFPVFFFLIGYSGKISSAKLLYFYAPLIVLVDLSINYPLFPLNILFSVILCRLLLHITEQKNALEKYPVQIFLLLILWFFATGLFIEYGSITVMFALLGALVRKNKKDISGKIFFLGTFLFYFYTQSSAFAFSYINSALFFILLGSCFVLLYNFCLVEILKQSRASFCINFIARNSLHIYFFHLIAFKIIDKISNPEKYIDFRWFL